MRKGRPPVSVICQTVKRLRKADPEAMLFELWPGMGLGQTVGDGIRGQGGFCYDPR